MSTSKQRKAAAHARLTGTTSGVVGKKKYISGALPAEPATKPKETPPAKKFY